jgi:hypothetical protein
MALVTDHLMAPVMARVKVLPMAQSSDLVMGLPKVHA